ncbi:ribonuclease H-like domain-containing protein [Bacillus sp. F19]|nr:ribonuclease H-like domain-containing protein [Bacillus sp. F19]
MSLKGKLNRLKTHMSLEGSSETVQTAHSEEIPNLEKWNALDAKPFWFDGEYCMVRERTFPLDYKHGLYQMGEFHRAVSLWNERNSLHPLSSKDHDSFELFFFDTETTGLGGGAGNTIFLLGHAQVFHDKVVVKQHFLPKPGNEVALYQSFLSHVNTKTLVTYNGKAFDWPQVKTRHTLVREQVPKLPAFGHFDLFHAARRLWKSSLESVKLSIVEKEILGIEREHDVPGYLAPMLYFTFVQSQDPDHIEGVMIHNEIDILSLITLYTHLSYRILFPGVEATDTEQYEVARWLLSAGDQETAFDTFRSVADRSEAKEFEAKFEMAMHLKRKKQLKEALPLFHSVAECTSLKQKAKAAVELAKYYEHKEKNYEKALSYATSAYLTIKAKDQTLKTDSEKEKLALLKRMKRLGNKSR